MENHNASVISVSGGRFEMEWGLSSVAGSPKERSGFQEEGLERFVRDRGK